MEVRREMSGLMEGRKRSHQQGSLKGSGYIRSEDQDGYRPSSVPTNTGSSSAMDQDRYRRSNSGSRRAMDQDGYRRSNSGSRRAMDQDGYRPSNSGSRRMSEWDEINISNEMETDFSSRQRRHRSGSRSEKSWGQQVKDGEINIRDVPCSIQYRRELYKKNRPLVTTEKSKIRKTYTGLWVKVSEVATLLDFLGKTVDSVEKKFGSGVSSFFRLLRFFILLNVIVSTGVIVFLLIPFASRENTENNRPPFHLRDLFSGQGSLEQSELFYGYYKPNTNFTALWLNYRTEDVYFYTVLVSYCVYLTVSMLVIMKSYKIMYTDRLDNFSQQFGSFVFSAWEMSINDKDVATALSVKNQLHLQRLLKKTTKNKRKRAKNEIIIIRVVLNFMLLASFAGIGYGIYRLTILQEDPDHSPFVLPVTMQAIMLVLPWILSVIGHFEKWSSLGKIVIGLARTFLLAATMLGVLVVYWLEKTERDNSKPSEEDTCWETRIGQELYKLLVYFFFFMVLATFVWESIHSMCYRLGLKYFGAPIFDISRNTSYLLYSQLITWLGLYYSPLLPIVQTLILVSMFYLKLSSLYVNCRASPKIWSNSSTQFLYEVLTLLCLLLAVIPYIFVITKLHHSTNCGPFNLLEAEYAEQLKKFFLFLPSVAAFLVIGASVICYYFRSLAVSRIKYGNTLAWQLKNAVRELKELKLECAG